MVALNDEIIDLYFGDADRRAGVAQALADSIGVFGNRRKDLQDSELANTSKISVKGFPSGYTGNICMGNQAIPSAFESGLTSKLRMVISESVRRT